MTQKNTLYSLTMAQQRIISTQMLYPESALFNIGGVAVVHGELRIDILRDAIQQLICCNDALQIRLVFTGENYVQYFTDESHIAIPHMDFCSDDLSFERWVDSEMSHPIPLNDAPLYMFYTFRLCEKRMGYLIKAHHVIMDGLSFQTLTNAICDQYRLISSETPNEQDNTIAPYREFIEVEQSYLQSKRYVKDKAYWLERLTGKRHLAVPMPNKTSGARVSVSIEESDAVMISQYCAKNSISMNDYFVGVFTLAEYKLFGQSEFIIGIPFLGRPSKRMRNTIGMFVDSLPIYVRVDPCENASQLLERIHIANSSAFRHHRYPLNHMIRDLELGKNILYDKSVNYYSTRLCDSFAGYKEQNFEGYSGDQHYAQQLIVRKWEGQHRIQLDLDYHKHRYTDKQAVDMLQRIRRLALTIHKTRQTPVERIEILSDTEKRKLSEYNDTKTVLLKKTVWDLFCEAACRLSDEPAVIHGSRVVSYQELAILVERFACVLLSREIKPGDVVCIRMNRSVEFIIAVLAAVRIGVAYIPIDSDAPMLRVQQIIKDSGAKLLLYEESLIPWSDISVQTCNVSAEQDVPKKCAGIQPPSMADTVYIIYTSGTTGTPKGVEIGHNALTNYVSWGIKHFATEERTIFPLFTSIAFDLTVTSIYVPLCAGGTIAIYNDTDTQTSLQQLLSDDLCTCMKLTPSHLRLLPQYPSAMSMRKIIVGGEQLSSRVAKMTVDHFCGRADIYNEYGPTEATVGCMLYHFDPSMIQGDHVPIGAPIQNTQLYVLNNDLQPLPLGYEGELFIAGNCLFKGYKNQAEITNGKVINIDHLGCTAYRTGDIVRFVNDGCMEFIGRKDSQLKINGYRIESLEIAQVMETYPGISGALVAVKQVNGSECLCAYYLSKVVVDVQALEKLLLAHLPHYMLPTWYCQLEEFPVTPNMKVDIAALPSPVLNSTFVKEGDSKALQALLACANDILFVEVSAQHSFYQAGGDSIKAILMSSKLLQLGWKLPSKEIMAYPNFSEMSEQMIPLVDQSFEPVVGLIRRTATFDWLFSKKEIDIKSYFQSAVVELNQSWSVETLSAVLAKLIKHHESLHMMITKDQQLVVPSQGSNEIRVHEMVDNAEHSSLSFFDDHFTMACDQIDPYAGKLIAATVIRGNAVHDTLVLTIHHITVDGVSWRILLEDMRVLLEQVANGLPMSLAVKTTSYQAWAEEMSKIAYQYDEQADYWENLLQLKPCFLPTPKIGKTSYVQGNCAWNHPEHHQPSEIILAGLVSSISNVYGWPYVIMELEGHGRYASTLDVSHTVGWFTCMYPVHLPCVKEVKQALQITQTVLREVPDHGIGFGLCSKLEDRWLFERGWIRFNFLGDITQNNVRFSARTYIGDLSSENVSVSCPLDVICFLLGDRLHLHIRFDESMFSQIDVQLLLERWRDSIQLLLLNEPDSKNTMPLAFPLVNLSRDDIKLLFEE